MTRAVVARSRGQPTLAADEGARRRKGVAKAEVAFAADPLNRSLHPSKGNIAVSKVVAIMSMSLDGYIADLNDGVADVFDWYFTSGDVEFNTGGADPMTFKVSAPSAEHLRGLWSELGAVLTGRRTFEVAHGWDGNHAWGPAFVLTHHIPAGWPRPNSTVHFVTDGIGSAVKQAKAPPLGSPLGSTAPTRSSSA